MYSAFTLRPPRWTLLGNSLSHKFQQHYFRRNLHLKCGRFLEVDARCKVSNQDPNTEFILKIMTVFHRYSKFVAEELLQELASSSSQTFIQFCVFDGQAPSPQSIFLGYFCRTTLHDACRSLPKSGMARSLIKDSPLTWASYIIQPLKL